MDCPSCAKGKIRVLTQMHCCCGHNMFVCTECFTFFSVECGSPFDGTKLPPAFPITKNERLTSHFLEDIPEGTEREEMRTYFQTFPLLEDFIPKKPN